MFIKKLSDKLSESFLISFEIITLKYLDFIPYGKCAFRAAFLSVSVEKQA